MTPTEKFKAQAFENITNKSIKSKVDMYQGLYKEPSVILEFGHFGHSGQTIDVYQDRTGLSRFGSVRFVWFEKIRRCDRTSV